VLLTGLSSSDDRIRGITCGADDFLSQPVNAEELVARVKSLVRLKEFTNELESAERVLLTLVLSIEAKDPYTKDHRNLTFRTLPAAIRFDRFNSPCPTMVSLKYNSTLSRLLPN
jgi:DNA-binding response OmpR family regulator